MTARLEMNGIERPYAEGVNNLEHLLTAIVEDNNGKNGGAIYEIKVDGNYFSEEYTHQARDIDLEQVERVEITTRGKEEFAQDFLEDLSVYFDNLIHGFETAAKKLRAPGTEMDGFDLLTRSLEMLYALRSHLVNVWKTLMREDAQLKTMALWNRFGALADKIIEAQEYGYIKELANLIENEMCPFLEKWKVTLSQG